MGRNLMVGDEIHMAGGSKVRISIKVRNWKPESGFTTLTAEMLNGILGVVVGDLMVFHVTAPDQVATFEFTAPLYRNNSELDRHNFTIRWNKPTSSSPQIYTSRWCRVVP